MRGESIRARAAFSRKCLNVRSQRRRARTETFATAVPEDCFDHWDCIKLLSAEVSARRTVAMTKMFLAIKGKIETLLSASVFPHTPYLALTPRALNLETQRMSAICEYHCFFSICQSTAAIEKKKKKSGLCRAHCSGFLATQTRLSWLLRMTTELCGKAARAGAERSVAVRASKSL